MMYFCACKALYVTFMCLVCPSKLMMCLALNGCFSRVFLNALHPRIPRVQPPLDERLFSTQSGVAAVYSVSDAILLFTNTNKNIVFHSSSGNGYNSIFKMLENTNVA